MKRLALAATVALAIFALGVGPAAANTLTTTEALAAQEDATSPRNSAADPGSGDPGSADPGQGGGQGGGNESSDPGGSTPPAEDAADPTGDAKDGAAEDGAAKDGATDDADASEPIDASFSLADHTMTAEEIGDPDSGIRYTIKSLKAGDVVTAEPGEENSTTVESDGAFTGVLLGNTELKTGDTLDVTVTVAREGQESKTFTGSVDVVAPDDGEPDVDLTVSPKTQSLGDYLTDGVQMTLVNCGIDEDVSFRITRKDDSETTIWEETQNTGEDDAGNATFMPGTGGDGWIGDFVVTASCGDKSAEATFTVTGDEDDEPNSDLTVTPKTQGLQKFFKNGINITLVNCVARDDVKFRVSTEHDPDTTVWEETQKAGEDAAGYANFVPDGDSGVGWVGEYLVMASCGDNTAETTFTVTGDSSVVDPTLSVDPKKLSGEDFVDRSKGVTITVTDCKPGSNVQFEVWGHDPAEKLYDRTARANESGTASIQVYGLEDRPEAYVGTYQAMANCMDQGLSDEFVVTDSGSGGSSSGTGDSGNAGSMPRTGAELTGLGAGALLILGGAATVMFARRKQTTS